jgi:hypothetical protein
MEKNTRPRWPLIAWAALLVFTCVLVIQQAYAGMRLISLPGVFLSAGMLCFLSAGFVLTSAGLRRSLYAVAYLLCGICLALSIRLILLR